MKLKNIKNFIIINIVRLKKKDKCTFLPRYFNINF